MTTILPVVLILSLAAPTAAMAAPSHRDTIKADAAMRKGIRDFARVGIEGKVAEASKIKVACRPVPKVGQKRPCTGTFRLTLDGRSADYTLTRNARTLRIAPGAIEYRVSATTTDDVPGLPAYTGAFSGFLQ